MIFQTLQTLLLPLTWEMLTVNKNVSKRQKNKNSITLEFYLEKNAGEEIKKEQSISNHRHVPN